MINKLKKKFTALATASILVLMTVLVLIMNVVSYASFVSENDTILDMLAQPDAPFFSRDASFTPKPSDAPEAADAGTETDRPGRPAAPAERPLRDFIPRGMSPEVPYESRFFTVHISPDGELLDPDFSRIVSIDGDAAADYAARALKSGRDRGFVGQFRYLKKTGSERTTLLFLDCGRKLNTLRTFLWTSVGVGLLGCVTVFIVFLFVSGRIVRPIAESYEKQKRFISDAGHEIRTPLTVIRANADLLACDGESEELAEIRSQTERLAELTNNLVLLSKMEETDHALQKVEFPLSDTVREAATPFRAPALAAGIGLETEIAPDITAVGSPDAIRQLVSILLDNALKYTPEGGRTALTLSAGRRSAELTVRNTTASDISEEDLPHLFDRFYRADASRNSSSGGHGIGLSIARAITEAHGGTISAASKNGGFSVTVSLPV